MAAAATEASDVASFKAGGDTGGGWGSNDANGDGVAPMDEVRGTIVGDRSGLFLSGSDVRLLIILGECSLGRSFDEGHVLGGDVGLSDEGLESGETSVVEDPADPVLGPF